jgi:hypothetical protein
VKRYPFSNASSSKGARSSTRSDQNRRSANYKKIHVLNDSIDDSLAPPPSASEECMLTQPQLPQLTVEVNPEEETTARVV